MKIGDTGWLVSHARCVRYGEVVEARVVACDLPPPWMTVHSVHGYTNCFAGEIFSTREDAERVHALKVLEV